MASFKSIAFSAILMVSLPLTAMGWFGDLAPSIATFNDQLCEQVECGKGTCKAGINYPYNFICECDRGWKRSAYDDVHENLKFLPCVIPNCTLNYACQPAPPPAPTTKTIPYNISYFDPCYWAYCGEGTCTATVYKQACECRTGYYNLLNETYFPCYSQCTIGSDCAGLGVRITTSASETTPSSGTGTTAASETTPPPSGKASSFLPGKLSWMAALLILMAMFL